ncbi:MAG: four helix bundle protein [Patescibacteria group bacterium]|jgi:four helix bundle protein
MGSTKFFEFWDWNEGHNLVLEIYKIIKKFPDTERFNLISQLRSAAVSIPTNIAEGTGRRTTKDLIHFLVQARGSAYEVIYLLYLSKSLNYLDEEIYRELFSRYNRLAAALNSHISSLDK